MNKVRRVALTGGVKPMIKCWPLSAVKSVVAITNINKITCDPTTDRLAASLIWMSSSLCVSVSLTLIKYIINNSQHQHHNKWLPCQCAFLMTSREDSLIWA